MGPKAVMNLKQRKRMREWSSSDQKKDQKLYNLKKIKKNKGEK